VFAFTRNVHGSAGNYSPHSIPLPIPATPLLREGVLGIDPAIGISAISGGHALRVAGELAIAGITPPAALQAIPILDSLRADGQYRPNHAQGGNGGQNGKGKNTAHR